MVPACKDDPAIEDSAVLWRRVLPRWWKETGAGGYRLTSAAFKDRTEGGLSVHLASMTTIDKVMANRPDDSLVAIRAGFIRSLIKYKKYNLVPDPLEDDPSHTLVCPTAHDKDAKSMAEEADKERLVYRPPSTKEPLPVTAAAPEGQKTEPPAPSARPPAAQRIPPSPEESIKVESAGCVTCGNLYTTRTGIHVRAWVRAAYNFLLGRRPMIFRRCPTCGHPLDHPKA